MSLRSADELQKWLNAKRDADVERLLRRHGIEYLYGIDRRPCTTDEAINRALCGTADAEEFDFGNRRRAAR